jgi:DNA processing protein
MLNALQTLTVIHTAGIGRKTARRMQRVAADLDPSDQGSSHVDASDLGRGDVDLEPLRAVFLQVRDDYPKMPCPGHDAFAEGIKAARAVLATCSGHDIEVLVPGVPGYAPPLMEVEHRPPILYRRGTLSSAPGIAVVGTRSASPWANRWAREIAERAAGAGFSVVSGLAPGCDAAAHRGCLEAGGHTVAVLPHGLDHVDPDTDEKLAADILRAGGAWISEYPPGVPATTHRRIRRNRLISGWTGGVIVIETGMRGALHAARSAREQGRPVAVAAPEGAERREANGLPEGNRALLAEGARPLRGPSDVEALLRQVGTPDVRAASQ